MVKLRQTIRKFDGQQTPPMTKEKNAGDVPTVAEIRAHFPAMERKEGVQAVAYFDGPGGTQVPRAVAEAMVDYLYHHNANTHWAFATSHETDAAIAAARKAFADFLNADADEIAFGANMTTLTFHVARALGRSFELGDEIIITELDHHANIAPWRELERERGVTIRVVKMDTNSFRLDWEDFARLLNARTRLVAVGAASNALGTITDVAKAAAMAHARGALIYVDAVHYAPHVLPDVRALDCDFLCCSAYKFYGPHIGILYGKRELLRSLDVPKLIPSPDTAPERLETGTQNHEGIVGAAAAVDFLASLSTHGSRRERLTHTFGAIHERESALLRQLWEGLSAIEEVKLYGPAPDAGRTPTLSFTVRGIEAETIARELASKGLFVSNGDFYATTVVERLKVSATGLVRIGIACYTTAEEVERLLAAVKEIIERHDE